MKKYEIWTNIKYTNHNEVRNNENLYKIIGIIRNKSKWNEYENKKQYEIIANNRKYEIIRNTN
jgi:hypothetical protein